MEPTRRFHSEIRRLVASVGPVLTIAERQEVLHLLDHGEPVEALRTFAWVISHKHAKLEADLMSEWKRLAQGAIDAAHLPPSFAL